MTTFLSATAVTGLLILVVLVIVLPGLWADGVKVVAVVAALLMFLVIVAHVIVGQAAAGWPTSFDACKKADGSPVTNNVGCPGYVYSPPPEMGGEYFGTHPDLGPVPTLRPDQLGTR